MIEGVEWFIVILTGITFVYTFYLVLSVQGDLHLAVTHNSNNDAQAAQVFIDLVNKARKSIVIHDDGNDSSESIYNNDDVLNAIRERVKGQPNLEIKFWFNDVAELKLLKLADEDCKSNISMWYSKGDRPVNENHYKIVDSGRIVHTSTHKHLESEREFELKEVTIPFAYGTRKRISNRHLIDFKSGISDATLRA